MDSRSSTETPWIVPAADLQTRQLLRVRLETPERRGRFRLLLLLESSERYQIRATHPLFNRKLWTLDVRAGEALLVDHLQKRSCMYGDRAEIAAVPLGPFPFAGIPALLLGFLPTGPSGEVARGTGELAFTDDDGRVWRVLTESGRVQAWSARKFGEELAAWRRGDPWHEMVAPDEGVRLRWRQTLRETGSIRIPELSATRDAGSGECDLGWMSGVADAPWQDAD